MAPLLTGCFDSPPQIISLTPDRGSIGVAADTIIQVRFDRPVVPQSVAGRFTVRTATTSGLPGCDLEAAFTAPPGAPCRIIWTNGDSVFTLEHPGAILAPDTQYTFTLQGGFRDPAGAVNTIDHTWFITTSGAPQVRAVSPGDGATSVPVDTPVTVDFNAGMDPVTTEAAIHLVPDVAGTRIIANSKDKSRFLVLPGHLLQQGVVYTLTIATTATDEHGQRLALPDTVAFATSGISPGPHGVVLARRGGEPATRVMLTALTPLEDGLPIAAEVALEAPRCAAPAGCGSVAVGAPLYTYSAAALSPDGRWLAVVERDATVTNAEPTLVIVDAASQALRARIPGGQLPAWSPDGTTLAYARGGDALLYHPASGSSGSLPAGDRLTAPPVWSPSGELLALPVSGPGGDQVELADSVVGARYPVPGLSPPETAPVISPDGSLLALYRPGPTSPGTWITGIGPGAAAPRLLDRYLVPLGFADSATLVAIAAPPGGALSLARVSVYGDEQIALPPAAGGFAVPAAAVSPSGRQLVYLASVAGVVNAYVENADGSDPVAITGFTPGTYAAASVSVS